MLIPQCQHLAYYATGRKWEVKCASCGWVWQSEKDKVQPTRSAIDHIQLELAIYMRAFESLDERIKEITNENYSDGVFDRLEPLLEERDFAIEELQKRGMIIHSD
jgi:hypothetical protein